MPFNPDGTFTPEDETTAPVAPQDASVQTQLGKVLAEDSPILQTARTRAAQEAEGKGLLSSTMALQAGEQAVIESALPIAQQEAAQLSQTNLQQRQLQSQEQLAREGFQVSKEFQERGLLSQAELQAADLAQRTETANLDRDVQERIALLNVAAHDREKATAAAIQVANIYGDMFRTIAANENIPTATRETFLEHIAATRDVNLNLVEQLYNFDLEWPVTAPAAA